jgi:hypothetical protein
LTKGKKKEKSMEYFGREKGNVQNGSNGGRRE